MVEVTMLDLNYAPDLLLTQCNKIGQFSGAPIRGYATFHSFPENPRVDSLKARFAADHLIDRQQGLLRLEPVVKAFAGGNITGMMITFDGEVPSSHTLHSFNSPEVALIGVVRQNPTGVEYRVRILKQDAAAIKIPDKFEPVEVVTKKTVAENRTKPLLFILIGVGSLAAGLLVYYLVNSRGQRSLG